ncbi:MAG: hypothetical protein WD016_10890 [Balneolaceae bacterium]
MTFLKILTGALVGTSVMTLFSYYLSNKTNKQFKEPVLLNKLIYHSTPIKNIMPGWMIHYSVGFFFMLGFHFFWKFTPFNPTFLSSTFLGLMGGLLGIAGWHFIFRLHADPPIVDFPKYYLHLLAAHVVFGWGATAGYTLIEG